MKDEFPPGGRFAKVNEFRTKPVTKVIFAGLLKPATTGHLLNVNFSGPQPAVCQEFLSINPEEHPEGWGK
jgi:hypothetical protein